MLYNKRAPDVTRRLQQDLAELEKLHTLAPTVIRFVAQGRDSAAPDSYVAEIGVTSFTEVTRQGIPIICERFKMEIKLPNGYPSRFLADCRIYPAPFHPHFKKMLLPFSGGYGTWVDPRGNDEGLGSLVLKIAHSLRFEQAYIDVNAPRVGNPEALAWYVYWQGFFSQNLKSWFPADKISLPETLPTTQKKFDIEPKKSAVGVDSPRPQRENRFAVTSASLTRKTFQIMESTPPYETISAATPNYKKSQPSNFRGTDQTHRLYIKPKAIGEIFKHISWGDKSTGTNKVEQGGIMLGHAYRDEATGVIFGVVEDSVAGDSATGTSAYLEMGHTTWKEMIDRVDSMLDANPNDDLQIIGWYHTHPNYLDVFMSGTDAGTQMRFFSNEWQFAIVLNPHKKIWRAFYGKNAEECEGFIIVEE